VIGTGIVTAGASNSSAGADCVTTPTGAAGERLHDGASDLLPTLIAAERFDDQAYARKDASSVFQQIGKRSDELRTCVLDTVSWCIHGDSRSARWVARDVSRELVGAGTRQAASARCA
jgi:hypothetical protein